MVPHGRGHHASAELAKHAISRDVHGRHVPNDCLPNHLSELAETHGSLLTRALPCDSFLALGRPRGAHVQKPLTQKAHAAVGAGASDRQPPRYDP
jgi:hypothetical protein